MELGSSSQFCMSSAEVWAVTEMCDNEEVDFGTCECVGIGVSRGKGRIQPGRLASLLYLGSRWHDVRSWEAASSVSSYAIAIRYDIWMTEPRD